MTEDSNELKASFGQLSMLSKGQEVNLSEIDPGLHRVFVGVGWNAPNESEGFPVDIDLTAFLLKPEGRVRRDTDFIFYNNLETEHGGIKHLGDSTTGDGDGDDERVDVDLEKLGFDIDRIAFCVTIHNAEERQQTFGLVKNAFIRIVNADTGAELAHYDLTEDASSDNGILFGELIRDGVKWKFKAIGQGSAGGLYKISREFGVNVAAP
jgi:tellurium resistance protein TerD